MHDDRGNASVSWRDAPEDYERPVLELLGDPKLSVKSEETFDPYARGGMRREAPRASGSTARTDLRKLSEWIKMMRALQERQRNGRRGRRLRRARAAASGARALDVRALARMRQPVEPA